MVPQLTRLMKYRVTHTDSLYVSIDNSSYYFPKEMNGKYRYTQDLLQLSQGTPGTNEPQVPEGLLQVVTPLRVDPNTQGGQIPDTLPR